MRRYIRLPKLVVCSSILLSLFLMCGIASAAGGTEWNTVISSNNFSGAAYNGTNQYVIVGSNGDIRTSADGINWVRQKSGTSNKLTKVIWDGSKYVAVGLDGTILTSQDGIKWTLQVSNTEINLESILFDGQRYLAAGWRYIIQEEPYATIHNVILYSEDAVEWEVLSIDPQIVLNDIVTNGTIYLISCENSEFLRSENGKDWTLVETGYDSSYTWMTSAAWNGNKFVAVGTGGLLLTSTDGISWSKISLPIYPSFVSVIWDGRRFAALDENSLLAFSPDGVSWKFQSIETSNYLTSIYFADGKYIITGFGETILTSSDGSSWQNIMEKAKYALWGATTDSQTFVMVGSNGVILTSADGRQWTERSSSTADTLRDVTWDGAQFIAIGDEGTYLTSKDGISWSKKVCNQMINPEKIIWTGSQYVIVGRDALILTSPDGDVWTKQTWSDYGGYDDWLTSICWNGNRLVAVGMFGTIITSTDGVNWETQNSYTRNNLNGIVWSGSQFVAAGDWKTFAISKDGINWTATAVDYEFEITDIIWNGKYYLATAYGKTLTSVDAKSWTEATISGVDLYYANAWNGFRYVLGGRGGTVVTATPLDIIKVTVDDVPIAFDVAPTAVNNRTLVPLRYIFNALGAEVKWDGTTQTVTAQKGSTEIKIQIGSDQATVNGTIVTLDVPAMTIDGRTMVPVRFVAENFNCNVTWDSDTGTVIINT